MLVAKYLSELNSTLKKIWKSDAKIGFVPTMGALHEGHLALLMKAKELCDYVVCSIFVNPMQFNNETDFLKYPKSISQDLHLLKSLKCDLTFVPELSEMFPHKPIVELNFGYLDSILEGKFRPGHFSGVGIVLTKLFHLIKPHIAFFGLKDIQQCVIVKQLVNDLNFDIQLYFVPTVREPDGLALSSRNKRLSPYARKIAPEIYKSLKLAEDILLKTKSISLAKDSAVRYLAKNNEIKLEYMEFVDLESFKILENEPTSNVAICIACYIEQVRLIDNLILHLNMT
jgi:pantoate--beta-alanine ligase